ncbi:MAG TPA: SDR family NAD(P)-dependent oxidoreductase, partial [Acetobacteraceae bacterium]|nr:SDR family NAD(P)-dependent oxidoreductase [Acetobacteraceae bacterium]
MEVNLTGRSALITGASKGLGLAMATEFAASGADVAILARRPAVLEEAKAHIGRTARGRVAAIPCDVARADQCRSAFDAAMHAFGKIDILVNNAGTSR